MLLKYVSYIKIISGVKNAGENVIGQDAGQLYGTDSSERKKYG
jgi:hypothetical protein